MAQLTLQNKEILRAIPQISAYLEPLAIELHHWSINPEAAELLAKSQLSPEEKEQALVFHDKYFKQLQEELGYQSRDLIVLHPEVPQLDELLAKFSRIHTHDDDEVRYIIDGSGIFGFCLPSGEQVKLLVEAGEYINVPQDTEHWFELDRHRRIKAVRYFSGTEGWVPNYLDKPILI